MHLFSNRSQRTSKCGKNKKVAHEAQHTTWNLFVKWMYAGSLESTRYLLLTEFEGKAHKSSRKNQVSTYS